MTKAGSSTRRTCGIGNSVHDAVRRWVAQHATDTYGSVLEVGSRDINGRVRDLIDTIDYHGIDLYPGPGVDQIIDVLDMVGLFDLVICCEVLEHAPDPRAVIDACGRLTTGRVIATAAGPGREPHSAFDGGPVRDGEHYGNLDASFLSVSWGRTVASEITDGDWRVVWERT